jgi:hypothetical protein|tara:strand:+ start:67 stop:420 length:354 start_codon:yes stop_codon:yes gene_type:complete
MANAYKNNIVSVITTNATIVYTVPAATVALIKSISVYNKTGGASNITLSIFDKSASATTEYAYEASVASLAKTEFLEGDESTLLVLEAEDQILLTSSNSGTSTPAISTVSVLQQDRT